jgi:hypothetical protein
VINHVRSHFRSSGAADQRQDLRPAHNPQLPDVALRKPFTRVQLAQALRKVMII